MEVGRREFFLENLAGGRRGGRGDTNAARVLPGGRKAVVPTARVAVTAPRTPHFMLLKSAVMWWWVGRVGREGELHDQRPWASFGVGGCNTFATVHFHCRKGPQSTLNMFPLLSRAVACVVGVWGDHARLGCS